MKPSSVLDKNFKMTGWTIDLVRLTKGGHPDGVISGADLATEIIKYDFWMERLAKERAALAAILDGPAIETKAEETT